VNKRELIENVAAATDLRHVNITAFNDVKFCVGGQVGHEGSQEALVKGGTE
jgi:hypothetical protein